MGEHNGSIVYFQSVRNRFHNYSHPKYRNLSKFRTIAALALFCLLLLPLFTAYAADLTDLSQFIVDAKIDGAIQVGEAYQVVPDQEYYITLTFKEDPPTKEFDDNETLTYNMPQGIIIPSGINDQPFYASVSYHGKYYQVPAKYTLTESGTLSITFDKTDENFTKYWLPAQNKVIQFGFYAKFSANASEIEFNESIKKELVYKPAEAYAKKEITGYDETSGIISYKITLTSDGDCTNINAVDTITGNALKLLTDSVQITGNSQSPTGTVTESGFNYTFPSMGRDETIVITYNAKVDFNDTTDSDKDGVINAEQTGNNVIVTSSGNTEGNISTSSKEITYKSIQKTGSVTTDDSGKTFIEWTITYNKPAIVSAAGDVITDTIPDEYSSYFTNFSNNTLTGKIYDQFDTEVGPLSDLPTPSSRDWTYTIPSDGADDHYYYVLTYKTEVNMDAINNSGSQKTLKNNVKFNKSKETPAGVNVEPNDTYNITKSVQEYTTSEVTWIVKIIVPASGLDEAEIIDTLPNIWIGTNHVYDRYISEPDSLNYTGNLDGETIVADASEEGTIKFKLYKNADKTEPGLKSSTNGHTIIMTYKTTVDQIWLQEGYTNSNPYYQKHTNSIRLKDKTVTYDLIFGKPRIEKMVTYFKDQNSFKYELIMAGISSIPVEITDTFDTTIMEVDTNPYRDKNFTISGGDASYQGTDPTAVSYSNTTSGISITVNNVPMQSDGNYYPYYRVTYWLKPKDGISLQNLASKAENFQYNLTNTASWSDKEPSTATHTETYEPLTKAILTNASASDRGVKYKITYNPEKAKLHNGAVKEMKDILGEKLSLDYGSIVITTEPSLAVPYEIHGGENGTTVVTYQVPDETKVEIEYTANVLGYGTVTDVTNNVSIGNYDKNTTSTQTVVERQLVDDYGVIPYFKIVKLDGNDGTEKIAGVEFKVYPTDETLATYYSEEGAYLNIRDQQNFIIYTSDDNGVVLIDGGDQNYKFYTDARYYIEELNPKEGYALIWPNPYSFKLSKEQNYDQFIYLYDDSMQIQNYHLQGLEIKKLVESDDAADQTRWFKFRVSVLDEQDNVDESFNQTISSRNGDLTFTNGILEFEIRRDNQKSLWGLPAGTKFKVEELDGEGDGNSYSVTDYTVTHQVVTDGTTVEETSNGSEYSGVTGSEYTLVTFTNTLTEKTEVTATKAWSNADGSTTAPSGASVVFTLYADGEATSHTVTLDGTADDSAPTVTGGYESAAWTATFVKLPKYKTVGTTTSEITYTVKETTPYSGYTASSTDPVASGSTITNTYSATGTGEIKVQKNLEGRDWKDNDSFTFTLTADSSNPATAMPDSTSVEIKKTDKNDQDKYIKSFGQFTFTKPGTYKYTVQETRGTEGGLSYDDTIHQIIIIVKDNGDGTLVADTTNPDNTLTPTVQITNNYSANGEGEIKVRKNLEGRTWNNDDVFEFKLSVSPVSDCPMPSTTVITIDKNTEQYTKSFGSMQFTKAGACDYTVTETHSGETINGIRYAEPQTVTINVIDKGNGEFEASNGTQLINTLAFTNTYTASGSLQFSVEKVFERWDVQSNFTVVMDAGNYITGMKLSRLFPDDQDLRKVVTKDRNTAIFLEIPFISDDIRTMESRNEKYTFVIDEVFLPTSITPTPSEYRIVLTPKDDGKGTIYFDVTVNDGEVQTLTDPVGKLFKFNIGTITNTYNATGEVTLGSSKHIVDNPETGKGTYTLPFELYHQKDFLDGEPIHTEMVTIESGQTTPFTYKLRYTLQSPAPQPDEGENVIIESLPELEKEDVAEKGVNADGKTTWDVKYVVHEKTVVVNELKPPSQTFYVTITVHDEGDGTLVTDSVKVAESADTEGTEVTPDAAGTLAVGEFENKERQNITVTTVTGRKEISGREWQESDSGKWEFTLTAVTEGAPMPEITAVTNNGQAFAFGPFTFTASMLGENSTPMDYVYKVSESGTVDGITNDTEKYFTITLSVIDDPDPDMQELQTEISYPDGQNALTFTNRTEETKITPTPTGPSFYRLPETGFSALRPTVLAQQPKDLSYRPLAWTLEIPSLALITDIVEGALHGRRVSGGLAGLLRGAAGGVWAAGRGSGHPHRAQPSQYHGSRSLRAAEGDGHRRPHLRPRSGGGAADLYRLCQ